MPLEEYRAKRDFTRSPEPAGTARPARRAGKRFFCVQKHLATRLHYDFRLEHAGVLLSWAVPKGPSLDPTDKRLAMHVEDHPIEYGEFEGIIPEGYGAGVVMLWDRGTWEPEVDDVEAALAKGDLKIRLDGYKLKGSWALVRTRGWAGSGHGRRGPSEDDGRSWLLIKHRDDWAGDLDITTFAPLSVKSGGDFADILTSDLPSFWFSNRPGRGPSELDISLAQIVEKVEKYQGKPVAPPAAPNGATKPSRGRQPAGTQKQRRGRKAEGGGRPTTPSEAGARKTAKKRG